MYPYSGSATLAGPKEVGAICYVPDPAPPPPPAPPKRKGIAYDDLPPINITNGMDSREYVERGRSGDWSNPGRVPHKCPVCEGRCKHPPGFYGEPACGNDVDCQSCDGKGVVWEGE